MLSETFEYMKRLHNDELYEDVITLGSFAMTALERNTDASLAQRCQCVVYYADALYNLDQFKKSEQAYYRALQMRKSMTKPLETRKHAELTSEADIRFRLHQCLMRQGKHQEAMGVLESIPDQQRTPKVRAALGRLYANEERRNANLSQQRRSGKVISNALLNYKRLLKDVPFAFETLATFLQVGGGLEDAEAAVASVSSELDWVDGWISAQGALARRDLASAAHHLRDLLAQSSISNNARLVAELGRVYHLAGERSKAIIQLQRAHSLDPFSVKGMDILAALLSEERKTKDLESLATRLMTDSPTSTEAWIALGYLCRAQNKVPKALYFAHKACEDDGWRPSTQAMLLKGRVLMDSKKFGEAAQHFHEALLSDRDCFELYEGLVQCQLEQNKMKEARLIARNCRDTLGLQAPRPLTLAASVLAKDPSTVGEAQVMLETAVNVAPYLLDAVYLLVDLYDKQGLYDKAISLLRQQTELHVNSKLHRLLGDFLSKTNRSIEAVDNYRHAQSLQPPDLLAASRMESLDCLPSFATPEVTAPAAAAFTTQLQMAPRRLGDGGRDTPMDDDQSF